MQNTKIDIIFENDDIVAINKPAGLLTLPDRYNANLPSVQSIFKQKYGEIFIVHRLDMGTSGILLLAKNAETHSSLNQQFAQHTIRKFYTAVVNGNIQQEHIDIDIPLIMGPKGIVYPSARGKESLTIIDVQKRYRNATLIKAELRTGRQHQIRVHTAAIGHPLLVDETYGNTNDFLLSSIKRRYNLSKNTTERPIIARLTLHSTELTFEKPDGSTQTLTAPYPKDFNALLNVLDKYASIE
jgi:23S rRNA pseudouridine955/2504/2580 synthase/23S rRNA pseudouridine1911/1915/1917 synthase